MHGAPAGIDKNRMRLHQVELTGAEHPVGRRVQGHVHGDNVGPLQQFVEWHAGDFKLSFGFGR